MKQRPDQDQGFSLIEILVVIAIISAVAALSFTAFNGGRSRVTPETIARDLTHMMHGARLKAIGQRAPVEVVIDLSQRKISVTGEKSTLDVPKDIEIEMLTGQELLKSPNEGSIVFFADGSSSGGHVSFSQSERIAANILIPWLTGIPELELEDS